MDNVGDWLYIVFLVIAGISGLFSSKDKKKAKRRPEISGQPDQEIVPNDNEPTKEKGFWEMLETEVMQQQEAKPKPKPRSKKSKRKIPQVEVKKEAPQPAPFLAAEELIHTQTAESKPTAPIQPETEVDGLMPEETFSDMAELRKAIICSEILNRKY